jgi:peptidyl-prolyl cis-trans isomerase C
MKRAFFGLAMAAVVGMGLISGCKKSEEMGPDTLMMVNGDPIKVEDLHRAWMMLSDQDKVAYGGVDGTKKLLDEMVTWKLMAQESERKHLDEDPSVKQELDLARQRILVNALLDKAVSDADIFRYFQDNFIRARFIVVQFPENAKPADKARAEKKAQAIYNELKGGADFRQTAQSRSDAENAGFGGEMGYVTHDTIKNMAGFQAAEAVFALKQPGQYTQPIEGNGGWYIFQLVEASGNLDPRGLSSKLRQALRDQKKEEVVRSYSNELNTRSDNVITPNQTAIQDLFDRVRKVEQAQTGKSVQPGSTVEPGSTAALQPGTMPGASVKTGNTSGK